MTHNEALILPFSEIRAEDLPLVGGKGANLGEMVNVGFPVPAGFCLTTAAFQLFMNSFPDHDSLYDLLDTVTPQDVENVRVVGEHIREKLLKIAVPDEIADSIKDIWHNFGSDKAYAVRSSATAEDLPDASFAGQQDTYLNIIGEKALLDAVRKCWVSLFTDRAILYRSQNNFPHRTVALSVVIQQMVMAEKSGTLFTANPLTGHRHTLTIDASFGLGEALVGGLVSPDSYQVDKRKQIILDRHIADKKIGIFPDKDGGTYELQLNDGQRNETVLTDPQILALADLGSQVEAHYGIPQDIEWAITDDRVYLLQTRPITSLYPIDGLTSPDDSLHIFFSLGHQQSMTRAMSPLSLSSIQVLLPIGHTESRFENTIIRSSGGRMFADITKPLRHPIARRAMSGLLSQLDALGPAMVQQAMERPEFRAKHGLRPSFGLLKFAFGVILRIFRALWWRDLTGFCEITNRRMDAFMENISNRLDMPPGKKQLQAVLKTMPEIFPFFLNWVPEAIAGIAATRILTRLANRWLSPDEVEALTLGIQGNVINEMNHSIGDLADLARQSPQLVEWFDHLGDDAQWWVEQTPKFENSELFLAAWNEFLIHYGSRGPAEIDIMMPRWNEDPLPVLRVIAELLNQEPGHHRSHFEALVKEREAVFKKLLADKGTGLRGYFLKRLYHTMTEVGGMREHHKYLTVRMIELIKEVLKGVAAKLVETGRLAQADDLWFLTWSELLEIWEDKSKDWSETIAQRQTQLERYQKLMPPLIVTSDGESPIVHYRVENAPPGALLGNPVSVGVVEGRAHIIRDPYSESLTPGEILVAEFTDPGWTPLFINAGGLILEVGGALTHGAVVAREYGMPAVVGVRGATREIKTGQQVRVDGNRGIVEIIG